MTPASGTCWPGSPRASVSFRSRSWQAKIVPQVNITPIAAASRAISNASGTKKLSSEPNTKTTDVITMPAHGTP